MLRRSLRGALIVTFIFSAAILLNQHHQEFKTRLSRPSLGKEHFDWDQEEKGNTHRLLSASSNTEKLPPVGAGVKERIIVEKGKNGERVFRIEGLPSTKLKEVRKFVKLTTPPMKVKQELGENIQGIYDRRRRKLIESCEGHTNYQWNKNMQLIAAPDKELAVCVVQKAGSSAWHHLVYKLRVPDGKWSGDGHAINRYHGKALSDDVKNKLIKSQRGTRVLTVRHPFARIISGWNDKFNKNHLAQSTRILTSSPGIEKYIGIHEADEYHLIAFEDFVQYLVDYGVKKIDAHFKSIEELCRPCDFPYDYITKAETSSRNVWWVLDRVGTTLPSFAKHFVKSNGTEEVDPKTDSWQVEKKIMSELFSKVPLDTVKGLMQMYNADFIRFGYSFDLETRSPGDVED